MITGFLTLAGTLVAILFWVMKRRAAKADDPHMQNLKRYDQINRDIAKENSLAATAHATDDLDQLERLRNR